MDKKVFWQNLRSLWNSILDGEVLFKLKIDKALPSILVVFLGMMFLIYVRYVTDKALATMEKANAEMLSAKLNYETKSCEYIGLIRESKVKDLAQSHGIHLQTPEKPARQLR